jgi:hypothetical protein
VSMHAYPRAAAFADLGRAGLGAGAVAVPLSVAPAATPVGLALLAALALFVALAVRAALLLVRRYRADEDGIAASGPFAATVAWRGLRRVRLAYYSTRRDRSRGWLQLTLADGRRRLSIDSRLDGFASLAARAADAARANRLRLDAATVGNFRALGIPVDEEPPVPGR